MKRKRGWTRGGGERQYKYSRGQRKPGFGQYLRGAIGKSRYRNYRRLGQGFVQLAKDVATLKSAINVEMKLSDTQEYYSKEEVPYTATTAKFLTPIAQGDDNDERDGSSVRLKSLWLKGFIRPGSSQTTARTCRVIIFNNREPTGTIATWSQLYGTSGITDNEDHFMAFRNWLNKSDYITMKDETFVVQPNGVNGSHVVFNWFFNLGVKGQGIRCLFNNDTTGDIGDVLKNALCAIAVSDGATVSTYPKLSMLGRFRFIDN